MIDAILFQWDAKIENMFLSEIVDGRQCQGCGVLYIDIQLQQNDRLSRHRLIKY